MCLKTIFKKKNLIQNLFVEKIWSDFRRQKFVKENFGEKLVGQTKILGNKIFWFQKKFDKKLCQKTFGQQNCW